MRTIGLLGGMSWESTAEYYRLLNTGVKHALGGLHSAQLVLHSVDFAPLEAMQRQGDWPGMGKVLADAACGLESTGADCVLICTNTMHKVAPVVADAIDIPLLHIADAAGEALVAAGVSRVGLLGTRFTMEQDFYRGRLAARFGLDVVVPDQRDRTEVDRIIYHELCLGRIESQSQRTYSDIVDRFSDQRVEAVILGCTEVGLLLSPDDVDLPLFDTTRLHAEMAVRFALADDSRDAI